jgi:predicted RNA-binding Zn ribbon-like protein
VQINPYGEGPVRLAVDLANDQPRTATELLERCRAAGLITPARATRADLAVTQQVLREWTTVVDAASEQERADRLNALIAKHASSPRVTNHDGTGWHIHFRKGPTTLGGMLAVLISVGTAFHLTVRGMHRLGRCRADDCHRMYADVTRNGRQRYCSTTCANRDAVRRHRRLHREH